MSFFHNHPRLMPSRITVVPAPDVAHYCVTFQRQLREEDVDLVRDFATQHGSIDDIEWDEQDKANVVIVCNHDDQGYQVLFWLQQELMPYRSYTAIAQLFTGVRPVVARVVMVGAQPELEDHIGFANELRKHPAVRTAQYAPDEDQIVVIFREDTTESGAMNTLNAQIFCGVTVMPDDKKRPLIQIKPDPAE